MNLVSSIARIWYSSAQIVRSDTTPSFGQVKMPSTIAVLAACIACAAGKSPRAPDAEYTTDALVATLRKGAWFGEPKCPNNIVHHSNTLTHCMALSAMALKY
jgi:hypothetical protein